MLQLFASLTTIAASVITPSFYEQKSLLLREVVDLVKNHSNMTVLDTSDFEDQVHILVDDIKHEFGDEFDLLMGRLSENGHITMVSANSTTDLVWPLEPLEILHYEPSSGHEKSNFEKRGFYDYIPRYLLSYPDNKCTGHFTGRQLMDPGQCVEIYTPDVHSTYMYNLGNYSMHMAMYRSPCCDPYKRRLYHWQRRHTAICYDAKYGNSMWWDWPDFNAP